MAKISKSAAKERIEALSAELERHNYNYYVLNASRVARRKAPARPAKEKFAKASIA